MTLKEEILKSLGQSNLHPFRKYASWELKHAVRKLIDENKLTVRKTDGCPGLIPFSWYMGEMDLGKESVKSSGEAFKSVVAQLRCIGELFERIPLHDREMPCKVLNKGELVSREGHGITSSNGLSYALELDTAVFNSYRELVERHVVLDYWLAKRECLRIKCRDGMSWLSRLSAWANGIRSNFYYLPNDYGMAVVCCHIQSSKNPPHNIFGYGCHATLEKAMEKAYLEAWRFVWEYKKLKNPERFRNNELKDFIDHFYAYAFDKDKPQAFFPGKSVSVAKINAMEESRSPFRYDRMTIFRLKKYDLPGYCVKLERDDFWSFKPGALEKDTKERKHGEIHPVA